MTAERQIETIGKQVLLTEGDLVLVRYFKDVTLEEVIGATEVYSRCYAKHKRIFILCDISQLTSIAPAARRYFVQWCKTVPITAAAVVGIGQIQRVITILVMNAVKLFTGFNVPCILCKEEAEAAAWLTRQRSLILSNGHSQSDPS